MSEKKPNLTDLLAQAIRLEMEGQDYFLAQAKLAKSPLTQKTFQALAADENRHLKKIEAIYHAVVTGGGWPKHEQLQPRTSDIKAIFEATKKEAPQFKEKTTDYEALQQALTLEKQSIVFYNGLLKNAVVEDEKKFLTMLIAEENEHYRLVADTIYYLFNTAAFFGEEEQNIYE